MTCQTWKNPASGEDGALPIVQAAQREQPDYEFSRPVTQVAFTVIRRWTVQSNLMVEVNHGWQ